MCAFQTFRKNVISLMDAHIVDSIFKMTGNSLEAILEGAEKYFNTSVEHLRFEVINVKKASSFTQTEYTVVVYPIHYNYTQNSPMFETKFIDGEFFFKKGKGSLLLMVTPPIEDGKAVKVNDVLEHLVHYPNCTVDSKKVQSIIKNAESKWSNIASFDYDERDNATCVIRIADDNMSAAVKILPPNINGGDIFAEDILELLKAEDINFGINLKLIDRIDKKSTYNQWLEVVKGERPETGDDAQIILTTLEKESSYYNKQLGGSVRSVHEGDVIAKKIPAQEGKNGFNIFKEIVFGEAGNDITMTADDNVQISDDNTEAIALIDGSVWLDNNHITITPVWIIDGDLTTNIGDINVSGSVMIRGSIPDEFTIKVEGSLTVLGSIGNSNIHVGKHLFVEQGINGRGKGEIFVGGDCVAKFVESANLTVKNICLIEDSILNSNILSFNKIIIVEGRGRISSSVVIAEKEIIAKNIGSDLGSSSHIKVVSYSKDRQRLESLIVKRHTLESIVLEIQNFFGNNLDKTYLDRISDSQKGQVKEKLIALKKSKIELEQVKGIINNINKKLTFSKTNIMINVLGDIKTGSEITLNDKTILIRTPVLNGSSYSLKDSEIVSNSSVNNKIIASVNEKILKQIKNNAKL